MSMPKVTIEVAAKPVRKAKSFLEKVGNTLGWKVYLRTLESEMDYAEKQGYHALADRLFDMGVEAHREYQNEKRYGETW